MRTAHDSVAAKICCRALDNNLGSPLLARDCRNQHTGKKRSKKYMYTIFVQQHATREDVRSGVCPQGSNLPRAQAQKQPPSALAP